MKIALLTLPLNSNYGGVLQAFALKSHLTRLGHEVWLIDNRKRLKPVSNAFLKTVLRRAVESLFHPKEIFAEMNTLLTQDYKKSEIEKFIYRRLTPKTQPVFDAADYAELAAPGTDSTSTSSAATRSGARATQATRSPISSRFWREAAPGVSPMPLRSAPATANTRANSACAAESCWPDSKGFRCVKTPPSGSVANTSAATARYTCSTRRCC